MEDWHERHRIGLWWSILVSFLAAVALFGLFLKGLEPVNGH